MMLSLVWQVCSLSPFEEPNISLFPFFQCSSVHSLVPAWFPLSTSQCWNCPSHCQQHCCQLSSWFLVRVHVSTWRILNSLAGKEGVTVVEASLRAGWLLRYFPFWSLRSSVHKETLSRDCRQCLSSRSWIIGFCIGLFIQSAPRAFHSLI